jgi:hypothetical protein
MSPEAATAKLLLYVGDWDTNDVNVFDYKSGKLVGALTGFDEPYGMCVDAAGDIYVSNFEGGNAVEYAHGGTTVLNTYDSSGEPIGCSVDAKGDVAATSFSPGEVTGRWVTTTKAISTASASTRRSISASCHTAARRCEP